MTSPAPSSQDVHGSNSDTMGNHPGAIYPTSSNGEHHQPYPVSTNPFGFSFIGQFCVQSGTTSQIPEKKSTEVSTQTSIGATEVAGSHVNEIHKIPEGDTYQKAVHERREKYLPSYSNFLPLNSFPQTGRVPPTNTPELHRSPLEDGTKGADGSELEKEITRGVK
ncbi:hypothetical protein C7212DRAFT_334973 [Tuber magnatum]|uniref:Uncharacterized protein n=1 Tax=Tuber magnatum TaxID=42249 RepID=A0A317SE27_9PEZI|nr:hypothetical protein C7212DRAFT_334973 [Tuber magnatum]